MEAKNIIFGTLALAVVGGGAYFYFKNKKKPSLADQLGTALSSSASTSSSSTTGGHKPAGAKDGSKSSGKDGVLDNAPVTNAQAQANQQETAKQIQAQGLATQISSLKSQFASLQTSVPTCHYPSFGSDSSAFSDYNKCNGVRTQILDIQSRMKDLGYKEDNGLAVKI